METSNLTEIFSHLKKLLASYAKQMDVRADTATDYHLYILNDIELAGRKLPECYFGGLKMNKKMVSLHFFPAYTHPAELKIPASVKSLLKGKSCFNISRLDDTVVKGVTELLAAGASLYRKHKVLKA